MYSITSYIYCVKTFILALDSLAGGCFLRAAIGRFRISAVNPMMFWVDLRTPFACDSSTNASMQTIQSLRLVYRLGYLERFLSFDMCMRKIQAWRAESELTTSVAEEQLEERV